jgi:hypothetical protein
MFVLFGGDDTRVYDDVHVFDAERNAWQELATTGARPGARWGHTMCVLPDRRLLVFGGHDGESMLNDLHILDTDSLVWTRLHTSTADALVPPPRAGHTASMINRTMIVFGGGDGDSLLNDCWSLTLDGDTTPHWHRLVASGAPPSARCAHTSITLPPRSGAAIDSFSARVLVFGGGDGARRFKDVYELDVNRLVEGNSPATRSAAAAAAAPAPPTVTVAAVVDSIEAHGEPLLRGQSGRARHSESIRRLTDVDTTTSSATRASTTATLRSFLDRVGLPQLHDTFVAQDIDVSVLPSLTETHLRELGVTTIGARLRIIAAAKELDSSSTSTVAATTTTSSNSATSGTPTKSAASSTTTTTTTTKRHADNNINNSDHHALLEAARALDSAVRLLSTSSTALGRLLHHADAAAISTAATTTLAPTTTTTTTTTNGNKSKQQQMSPRKNGANRHQLQFAQGHG